MADETPEKHIFVKKDLLNNKFKEFVLDDPQTALIVALQDLTHQIARLANKQW